MIKALIHIIYAKKGKKYERRYLYHGNLPQPEQVITIYPAGMIKIDELLYSEWREIKPTCPDYNLPILGKDDVNVIRNESISWKEISKSRMEQKAKDNGNNRYKTSKKPIKDAYRVKHF